MSKTLYLITFLSALLLKSETSFGQELKKELGVCGKTMGAIFGGESVDKYELQAASIKDTEFCDDGRYEENPNFIIYLYNAEKKAVYDKHIYLNPWTFSESVDEKGEFKKTKLKNHGNSRIVKFPITKEMGVIESYKVKSLKNKKESEIRKIKW